MSSKLQNIDTSLKDLVYAIENGVYTIPKFQRDFVWKTSDIDSLGDSIIRGYPISSLLIMPCNGTLKIGTDPLKTNGSLVSKDLSKLMYVLDGQQRITAIAKIFLNLDSERRYYFDLLLILDEAFPEDRIFVENTDTRTRTGENFCRHFQKSKKVDEEATKHNYRFISGKSIIEDKFGSVINKFLNHLNGITEEQYDKYLNYLSALLGAISSYGIPTTVISQDADLGLVCRVFEKVNSSGIKLTTFDLINAKSFDSKVVEHEGGLANYLTEDLKRNLENNYNDNIEKTYINYLGYDSGTNKFSDLSRIVRTFAVYDMIRNDKLPVITNHQMLSKKSEFWFNIWEEKRDIFFSYLNWLSKENISDLGPAAYYEYMGGIFISNPRLLEITSFTRYIKMEALSLGIRGDSFSKSDLETVSENIELGKKILNASEFEKEKMIPKININILEDDISKFNKGRISYNVALYIMFHEKRGKFTHDILGYPIKIEDFDEHHIIPKTQTKGKSSIYNTITK